ncbi:MAG: LPXTG cell wall anchor domain-containing protein, partial [Oscillospiraceae bacterium]|nr:LPXTG cell wall anchor domain-containing protein [Oscillospiraceae bacterium]
EILWESIDREDILTDLTGDIVTGEIEFTKDVTKGSLSADVENKKGTVLPETGGIGTKIFYFGGGALAVIAVVLLVTRKRMTSSK